ncbi:unnamed protein product (macronuclear) [Paramecium tetraurelia]|uniref:Uncharacterized protein n=1 Tax=Paramecium tetraurelia TaxID=5888 RepID=A0DIX0_PARTE|nr:uncharacterized protein GSPATT00017344001 [Paramecium tetraurelia]CAK82987.1 unnamed protein product [Paramecium tetraurelia]|eukprot:XP_001450384.1 hypothetical protein (macronuclear) [Paramecium tetraurelia strain d4-2]
MGISDLILLQVPPVVNYTDVQAQPSSMQVTQTSLPNNDRMLFQYNILININYIYIYCSNKY